MIKSMTKETIKVEPEEVTQDLAVVNEGQPIVPTEFKSQLTRAQVDVIKEQFAKGATDTELKMFLYVCQRTGLDPFSKQIHLVPRWDSRMGKEVRSIIIGIDGLRSTAERTGAYAGNSDPMFDGEVEAELVKKDFATKKEVVRKFMAPARATVTVKKIVQGVICDFTATVEWAEYYPKKGGDMWANMPKSQLGKCAEAKALRKAFPAVMSGVYVAEEMQHAIVQVPPEQPETAMKTALSMISQVKNIDGLINLQEKIAGSKKYSKKEKDNILAAIKMRLLEIEPDNTKDHVIQA
jgi:phage recombination protein Bet